MRSDHDRLGRRRGRPARGDGPEVSRDALAERALQIAGAEGFAAVTMHRLAREIGVTPRALYNYVRDRQDVIDAAAARMVQELPEQRFDADNWRPSIREAYARAREAYRRYPRALLISLDETITPAGVDRKRVVAPEEMLRFFVEIGLSLEQAVTMRGAMAQPVPEAWLAVHPDVDAALSREYATRPPRSSEEMFDAFVETRIAAIEAMLSTRSGTRVTCDPEL